MQRNLIAIALTSACASRSELPTIDPRPDAQVDAVTFVYGSVFERPAAILRDGESFTYRHRDVSTSAVRAVIDPLLGAGDAVVVVGPHFSHALAHHLSACTPEQPREPDGASIEGDIADALFELLTATAAIDLELDGLDGPTGPTIPCDRDATIAAIVESTSLKFVSVVESAIIARTEQSLEGVHVDAISLSCVLRSSLDCNELDVSMYGEWSRGDFGLTTTIADNRIELGPLDAAGKVLQSRWVAELARLGRSRHGGVSLYATNRDGMSAHIGIANDELAIDYVAARDSIELTWAPWHAELVTAAFDRAQRSTTSIALEHAEWRETEWRNVAWLDLEGRLAPTPRLALGARP